MNRIGRDFVAPVLAILVSVGLLLGAIGWLITREPAQVEITPTLRFVAFAMATMGVAWLIGPFLLTAPRHPSEELGAMPATAVSSQACPGPNMPAKERRHGTPKDPADGPNWPSLFHWAAAIDAAGVAIVVASVVSDAVTWRQGVMLYAILASFALLQLAATWLALRLSRSAGAAAIVGVAIMVVGCTSLMWGHLADRPFATGSPADHAVRAAVRYVNPLLAANDAITPPTSFDWAHHEQMYAHYGIIGESRLLGLPDWAIACGWYLGVAGALGLLARLCRTIQTGRKKKTTTDFTDLH